MFQAIHIPARGLKYFAALFLTALLAACGGGGGSAEVEQPEPTPGATCVTSDNGSSDSDCGNVLIGMTDADGDFRTYSVEVLSLNLSRADGTTVSVLPTRSMVDFAQYVELSELVTAATVPAGTYTSGEIILSYSDSDIQVELDGVAQTASVVNSDGSPVNEVTLELQIDNRRQLTVAPGIPALLEVDFNLAASHQINLEQTPITAELLPVLTAEINPLEQREFRVRGPLISTSETDNQYRIAVRPFLLRDARHGGFDIHIDEQTTWEIGGEGFVGAQGLTQLASEGEGTATVAFGTFDRIERRFTAEMVYAASSVMGGSLDAISGHIISREGDVLMLKGARLVRADGSVTFNDTMLVLVGPETTVRKPRFPHEQQNTDSLSIGQRVSILGEWIDGEDMLDATAGFARLHITTAAGILLQQTDSDAFIDVRNFNGRPVDLFDFTGMETDPANYQVSTSQLQTGFSEGAPLHFRGFVTPAPNTGPDFDALSAIDFSNSRAQLLVGWKGDAPGNPFTTLDANGFTLALQANDLTRVHHLRRGGIITDLLGLDSVPSMQPRAERGLYAIAEDGAITLHSGFAAFASDLQGRLNRGSGVRALHAVGGYRSEANSFHFYRLAAAIK
ncbi:DUF4382 domain-containing protein [Biformimicrobium ophioploci]|uniref:DUF4382 domain-containing protein n=1 Tax=Biformimicrobium ophioploci TaxID=3036711 RepID=A0ABQ6LZH3_9GAMM|nr:DUF4382 domain-containing protein [Microbulbifer sp. NKW57]GMG87490.1 hypothetical protein MNKW57_18110 [Microbulbifer sp. NKW57]